jgi:hypothetical protein
MFISNEIGGSYRIDGEKDLLITKRSPSVSWADIGLSYKLIISGFYFLYYGKTIGAKIRSTITAIKFIWGLTIW